MGSKVAKSPAIAEDAGGRVTTALKPSVFGSGNPRRNQSARWLQIGRR